MGSKKQSLFNKSKAGRQKRKEQDTEMRRTQWLIVCEGTKTERFYFDGLARHLKEKGNASLNVRAVGTGRSTKGVVKSVEDYFDLVSKEYGASRIPYLPEKIIIVFDKDDFTANDFNSAIHMAESRYPGCTVAWSNESFELWLCLHFEYIQTPLHRDAYNDKLTAIFREKGIFKPHENFDKNGKNDEALFEQIKKCGGKMQNAIR